MSEVLKEKIFSDIVKKYIATYSTETVERYKSGDIVVLTDGNPCSYSSWEEVFDYRIKYDLLDDLNDRGYTFVENIIGKENISYLVESQATTPVGKMFIAAEKISFINKHDIDITDNGLDCIANEMTEAKASLDSSVSRGSELIKSNER